MVRITLQYQDVGIDSNLQIINQSSCGKTGCIESVAAHKRVVARAERELQNWPMSVLNGRELSFASISNAADIIRTLPFCRLESIICS